jgi:nucleotide-binding universal stress UspA family protein
MDDPVSEKALDVACRLASEKRSSLAAVVVIEIPPALPLDAHMLEEEDDAHKLLDRAEAVGDSYGVSVSPRILRAREAAGAIADHARALDAELIVTAAPRDSRRIPNAPIFETTIEDLLRKAPCRVMVIAARLDTAAPMRTPALSSPA